MGPAAKVNRPWRRWRMPRRQMCLTRCWWSVATFRRHFDFDFHVRLVKPGNHQQGRGRADLAEVGTGDGEYRIGVAGIGDVIDRTHDVGHGKAGLSERSADGPEAVLC